MMADPVVVTGDPEKDAWLFAEPSPLNPIPAPDEPGGASSVNPIPAAKTFDPFNQPGTGILNRLNSFPAQVAVSALTNAAIPGSGFLGMFGRTAAQGALGGGQAALEGRPMSDIALGTGLGIAGQSAGELLGPAAKIPMLQTAGRQAEEANAALKNTFLRDLEETKARNQAANLGFKAQAQQIAEKNVLGQAAQTGIQRQWIENRSNQFMDALKQDIPEFNVLPKGSEGIKQYMFGKGYDLIHEGYDAAIKDLVSQAKGKTIDISPEAAAAFGIKSSGPELSPNVRDLLRAAGKDVPTSGYDAAQAITAITGKWRKNPDAYREVADALTDAGLTNPMAEKYKTAIGLQTFLQKSGALKETGVVDPALLQKALYDVNKVQELQRRNLGNVSEGKLQAFLGGPGEFKETPLPAKPIPEALPTEPSPAANVKYGPLMPGVVRHGMTFAVPLYTAHAAGLPYPAAAGVGATTAALASKFLPTGKRVIEAPLSDRQMELLRMLPIAGGAAGATTARGFLSNMRTSQQEP